MHSWHHSLHKALDHKLYRAIHLARTNQDYRLKYPAEVRANPQGLVLTECHKEAAIRIQKVHDLLCKRTFVDPVDRPKRWNRQVE